MPLVSSLSTSVSAQLLPPTGGATSFITIPDYDTAGSVLGAMTPWLSANDATFTGGAGALGAYTPVYGFYADYYGDGGGRFYMCDALAPNTIYASDSADLVQGGQFNDTFLMGGGDDFVVAGAGDDVVSGGNGSDILYGQEGNDLLFGDAGNDRLYGGSGDDILEGGAGADLLAGGTGIDWASYSQSVRGVNVYLDGAGTNTGDAAGDRLNSIENLEGSNFNDGLNGDAGANVISGLGGDDTLHGGGGNDLIFGGSGGDVIYGDTGNDALYGDAGNDFLHGGAGDDFLSGGEGRNVLWGDAGNDVFDLTTGWSDAHGGADDDTVILDGALDEWQIVDRGMVQTSPRGTMEHLYELTHTAGDDAGTLYRVYDVEQLNFNDGSIFYL